MPAGISGLSGLNYGGSFVAETLIHALDELKAAYAHYRQDPEFVAEYRTNWRTSSAGPARSTTPRG
jgi:tryptophan synthase beta subunit